jgi:hypothetical protein
MAHGENAQKRSKDWWGRRPLSGIPVRPSGMKYWKRLCHKIERQEWKKFNHNAN